MQNKKPPSLGVRKALYISYFILYIYTRYSLHLRLASRIIIPFSRICEDDKFISFLYFGCKDIACF